MRCRTSVVLESGDKAVENEHGDIAGCRRRDSARSALRNRNIGLDQPRLHLVIAQAGARVEGTDIIERQRNGLNGTAYGSGDLFVLLVLQRAQV